MADSQLAIHNLIGAEAEHRGRSNRCRHVHGQREQHLADRDIYAGVGRLQSLPAKALVFIILATEGDDHAEHRNCFVDDRKRFPFHRLNVHQPVLNVRGIITH